MHHIIVANGHHRVHCDCKHSVPVKFIILCTTQDENNKDLILVSWLQMAKSTGLIIDH